MLGETHHIPFFTGHQFQNNEKPSLSLYIAPYSCVYAVSLSNFTEVLELGHMDFARDTTLALDQRVQFFMRNFSLQNRHFENVLVSVLTHDFTIVPISYSEEKSISDFLKFSIANVREKHFFSNKQNDFRFCYALDSDLRQMLEKNFNNVFIRHSGAVNLDLFFNHRAFVSCQAALFLGNGIMELALKQNEKLIYYNVLDWTSKEDLLYFVLFAFEQNGFDPLLTKLAICGEFTLESENFKALKKHIKTIVPLVTSEPVKTHKEIALLPKHNYFTVLNQYTCEL